MNPTMQPVAAAGSRGSAPPRYSLAQAAVALILGMLIWAYVDSRRTEKQDFEVRLDLQVPDGWQIESPLPPEKVRISCRGARQIMSALSADRLRLARRIEIPRDAEDVFTLRLPLAGEQIAALPYGVEVMAVEPPAIEIKVARLVDKYVPVEAVIEGKPEAGYTVGRVQVEPRVIAVRGPRRLLDLIGPTETVKTKGVDISGKRYAAADRVGLQPFVKDGLTLPVNGTVYVIVELNEIPSRLTLEEAVPVRMLQAPGAAAEKISVLDPPAVKVTVEGAQILVSRLKASDIVVYIDMLDLMPTDKDAFSFRCRALAPEGIKVIRIEPPTVQGVKR